LAALDLGAGTLKADLWDYLERQRKLDHIKAEQERQRRELEDGAVARENAGWSLSRLFRRMKLILILLNIAIWSWTLTTLVKLLQ
jgi:hypothetical protein